MNHSKKINIVIIALALSLSFTVTNAQAGTGVRQPKWVSAKGYWVVETTGGKRGAHIIHFYNNDNQLVYRETLSGVSVKTSRRNVKMKLKKVLETSVAGYALKKEKTENLALVAKAL
ncbi:MAG: hypothetical protein EOO05_14345 [Chitinophagaceae bacterium]|nr:MAG: hypothetical protein EOO05_14345 [Chitinophagaceae bacterium]